MNKKYLIAYLLSAFLIIPTWGQNAKLSLAMKNAKIETILQQIESQTEYRFSYNKEQVDINRRISITVNNESINEILNKIFAGTNVQYTISGNQIILKYTAKPGKKKVNVKGRILDENNEPMPGVTILIENSSIGTVSDIGRCVKKRTFLFYAQSPDFHKPGFCYIPKFL